MALWPSPAPAGTLAPGERLMTVPMIHLTADQATAGVEEHLVAVRLVTPAALPGGEVHS